jgi:hypothetical protein
VLQAKEVAAVDQLLDVVGLKEDASDPEDDGEEADGQDEEEPVGMPGEWISTPVFTPPRQAENGAPCVRCRYFRPLPTFDDGVEGMRLCWSRKPAWNFTCFELRREVAHESRSESGSALGGHPER